MFWRYYCTLGAHLSRSARNYASGLGAGVLPPGHYVQWNVESLGRPRAGSTDAVIPTGGHGHRDWPRPGLYGGHKAAEPTRPRQSPTRPHVLRNNTDAVLVSPQPKIFLSSFKSRSSHLHHRDHLRSKGWQLEENFVFVSLIAKLKFKAIFFFTVK